MSVHLWTQENIDAYVANGLSADERATVERHVAECAECTQALAQARKLESAMSILFLGAQPDPNLETRAIDRLRQVPTARPMWVRYVLAAAAVLVLGLFGAIAQAVVQHGDGRILVSKASFDVVGGTVYGLPQKEPMAEGGSHFGAVDADPAAKDFDKDISPMTDRFADVSVPGSFNPNMIGDHFSVLGRSITAGKDGRTGIMDGDKRGGAVNRPAPGGFGGQGQGGATDGIGEMGGYSPRGEPLQGTFYGRSGATREYALRSGGGAGASKEPGWKTPEIPQYGLSPADNEVAEKKRVERYLDEKYPAAKGKPSGGNFLSVPEDDLLSDFPLRPAAPSYFKPGETGIPPALSLPPIHAPSKIVVSNKEMPKEIAKHEKLGFGRDFTSSSAGEKQPPPPPVETNRKIIRTGDMDFETESFDTAVTGITNLILAVKGGFIATINSDKLPNGKMKGAVVVRMPPQYLDKFILDLRGLLTMKGELKGQRIGSQDVTKQYTDIESELRAARAVEGRLIEIIKTGKGEVKDLIAAERELGTWRTKIEKMEGEIRYYNNQVSLSTLTINLSEKDIQMPSALVINEKVKMRLEVDDVAKALDAAATAVKEAKGRIVNAESKQHKAGQYEAFLHAEVPAGQASAFRTQLRKLGIVSEDDATKKTQAEGGSGKPGNLEARVNDVVFEVTLNNIVNVQPRHSISIDIVSSDVAASFEKLKALVTRDAKGQMRVNNLNEPDKQRVTANLDFNVPTDKRVAVDTLLGELGPVLKKTNVQAPVDQVATEQKFGYVVNLYSIATIAPREKVVMKILVDDVAGRTTEIEGLAKLSRGQSQRGPFAKTPQGEISGIIALHVPLSASDTLVKQIGGLAKKVVNQDQTPNSSAPENDLATSLIIVQLVGGSPLLPSDQGGIWSDVGNGLSFAFWLLSKGVLFIIIGLCGVLPWVLVIWLGVKACMWMFGGTPAPVEMVETPAVTEAEKPTP